MRVAHPWRWAVSGVVLIALLVVAYAAWRAHQVSSELSAATDDAARLQDAVERGDSAAMDRALDDLRAHSTAARDHTAGWDWSLATHLPAYGDDARGVRLASRVVADLSESGLSDLAHSANELTSVVPRKGRVDVDAVAGLADGVDSAADALADARTQLATQDPVGFVGPLKRKFRDLESRVDSAASTMSTARTAVAVLPEMLGADGPRDYLFVFQNNAEIRATGGLPGAVSLLHTQNGRITMPLQVPGSDIETPTTSVVPLTAAERDIYGDQIGTYFLDANVTPDFPRVAQIWKAGWESAGLGGKNSDIDGVVTMDPVVLSYLLAATGPVTVDGVTLTGDNAVDYLLHDVYVKTPDPTKQDAFFRDVAKSVFERVAGGTSSPQALIKAFAKGAVEHRLLIHDFDDAVQKRLDGTPVAGQLATTATSDPQVSFTLDDSTMSKMSYYLRYDVAVRSTYCTNGVQGLTGSATLSSRLDEDQVAGLSSYILGGYRDYQIPKGSQLVSIYIHGPIGGSVGHVQQDGKPDDSAWVSKEHGRPVVQTYAILAPGQTVDLTWQMKSGKGQTGATDVNVTPGIEPSSTSSTTPSSCG